LTPAVASLREGRCGGRAAATTGCTRRSKPAGVDSAAFVEPISTSERDYGVNGDVVFRADSAADFLVVVQHRRFVLVLVLADDDDAPEKDGGEQEPHLVDRGLVAAFLVAVACLSAGGHGGGLGDSHQIETDVAVGQWIGRRICLSHEKSFSG
jgi:hypothetical protein